MVYQFSISHVEFDGIKCIKVFTIGLGEFCSYHPTPYSEILTTEFLDDNILKPETEIKKIILDSLETGIIKFKIEFPNVIYYNLIAELLTV